MKHSVDRPLPLTWTRTFVAFSTLAAGFVYLAFDDGLPHVRLEASEILGWVLVGTILSAPFMLRLRSMAAQIFGRAVLLQAALFCVFALVNNLSVRGTSIDMLIEILAALAAALWPLIIIGRRGLMLNSMTFSPNVYRFTLTASMVLGLADAWALIFYSVMLSQVGLMFVCAAVMAAAIFGLFRMKVWGLVLCITANVVIASLALGGAFDLPAAVLSWGLVATATLQLLLPIPLVITIVRVARSRQLASRAKSGSK